MSSGVAKPYLKVIKLSRDVKTSRPYASGNAVKDGLTGKVLISVEERRGIRFHITSGK